MKNIILTGFSVLIFISCSNSQNNSDGTDDFIHSVHGKIAITDLGLH